ncbi:MAG TPA: UdgX family uracil-DNA binding protein [Nocardioidaceae bacterium]|nr:UdgX family uracil-DNA binding protein [Nocardioidaceae bacterium]
MNGEYDGAGAWVPERHTIPALRSAAESCQGCDLYLHATQVVMGDGPPDATLMLVGEQPGDKEDLAGEPFVGPAGQLLDKALDAAGIRPGSVYRTNVVKHFRFSGTRGKQRIHQSPARWHVAACEPWLIAELDAVRPQGVVLLGATAGAALYGTSFRIGRTRGRLQEWPGNHPVPSPPQWVLPTTHPSAVLRSRSRTADFDALVADLVVARDASGRQ